MVRAAQDDFMQSFRFHVVENNFLGEVAGFNSVTLPELSIDAAEYREGNKVYTLKQPGIPTVSDVSLSSGVVRSGTDFWDTIQAGLVGEEYRVNFQIKIFHQTDIDGQEFTFDGVSSKTVAIKQAFATRVKPLGDLDATSGEIMLREMDMSVEYFQITEAEGDAG